MEFPSLAIHLDFGLRLVADDMAARAVAEIFTRPCFSDLERLSARRKNRWTRHTASTVDAIANYLIDPEVDAAAFESERGHELVASGQVENGVRIRETTPPELRCTITVAVRFVAVQSVAMISAICDLAAVVGAAAGYIALESRYGLAHEVALGGFRPRERVGLSQQRFRERRGRHHYDDHIASELAGVEWGTFLGPGHLAKVNLDELRRSGAFAHVVDVTPALIYLQVTEDPMDDLTDTFEDKLLAARRALAPLLMDVSAISLA